MFVKADNYHPVIILVLISSNKERDVVDIHYFTGPG